MFKRGGLPVVPPISSARRSPSPSPSSTVGSPPPTLNSAQSPDLPSLEEIDQKFSDAELDRRRAFEDARSQQKLAFLEQIASQREIEEKRDEQFGALLSDVRKTYSENREERHRAFAESQGERDALVSSQEDIRTGLFNTAQASRETEFRSIQEQRVKRAEWFFQQRDQLFRQGRAHRETVSSRLVAVISDKFNALIITEEAEFVADQANYNEQVKAKATEVQTAERAKAGNSSPGSPPRAEVKAPTKASKTNSKTSGTDISVTEYLDYYSNLFREQENHREETFGKDQEVYSALFKDAEMKRKAAIPRRQILFVEAKNIFEQKFKADRELYGARFKRDLARPDSHASRREAQFNASISTYSVLFKQDHTWVKKQFDTASEAERRFWEWCSSRVQDLLASFLRNLEQVLSNHQAVFEMLLDGYRDKLGSSANEGPAGYTNEPITIPAVPVQVMPPYGSYPMIMPMSAPSIIMPPQYPYPMVVQPPTMISTHRMSDSEEEEERPNVVITKPDSQEEPPKPPPQLVRAGSSMKPPEPDALFTPRILFTGGIFNNKLPVPDSRLYLYDATRSGLLRMLQDHSAVFHATQEKRQNTFEENLVLKWTPIPADVLDEDIQFKEALKKFEVQAEKRERGHADTFAEDQAKREKRFGDAEERREREFVESVKSNQDRFLAEMKSSETKFYAQLEDLMAGVYSDEASRNREVVSFEVEQTQKIHEGLRMWKIKFAVAREWRQVRLTALLQSV
ncbi:hypothetical protein EIP91_002991 [Steccherinum ochraceum]|uniref:Uncharacterized protein n=1 Tax=Steccherinum ochraceum TaxID=92696 RepID=A0A4R0RHH4_9APHY|nr:hypothetical protein EIP91_002991 [Steccherinum ochraceum]